MTGMTPVPEVFRHAVSTLKSVRPRSELTFEEVRPPQRLAPWAYALSAEVTGPTNEFASGRLVVLHDPDNIDIWNGELRVVVYLQAELDSEFASDPLLPQVGWSWLTDALEGCGARWTTLGGTVTVTSSARFGEIEGPAHTHDLELRASWTASDSELAPHGEALCEVLASAAGLPPIGVVELRPR
nr:DUF3000 domain-containing protein [Actinoalloteichus hymeniacidonis]